MRFAALAYPKSVCLETYGLCNGQCLFCPYTDMTKRGWTPAKMDTELVLDIINQLSQLPIERFSLFNNNEPLLDERMMSFIRYARKKMPAVRQTLSSNGRVLTAEQAEAAIRAGIDRFFISIPTLDAEAYGQIMGAPLEGVLRAVDGISPDMRPNIRIAVPRTRFFDERAYEQTFSARGIRYIVWDMEANVGWDNFAAIRRVADVPFGVGCDRPLDQMIISSNGDVLVCCRDWYHENIAGSLLTQTVRQVWSGPEMRRLQTEIERKAFGNIQCCSRCSRAMGGGCL